MPVPALAVTIDLTLLFASTVYEYGIAATLPLLRLAGVPEFGQLPPAKGGTVDGALVRHVDVGASESGGRSECRREADPWAMARSG